MRVEQHSTLGGYHNLCSNGAMEQTGDSEMLISLIAFISLCLGPQHIILFFSSRYSIL